jgi:hypothetical protein
MSFAIDERYSLARHNISRAERAVALRDWVASDYQGFLAPQQAFASSQHFSPVLQHS